MASKTKTSSLKKVTTFVILGATGDLARKKLYPGLSSLLKEGRLSREDIFVLGAGRREKSSLDAFLDKQCVNVKQDKEWQKKVLYPLSSYFSLEGSYTDEAVYRKLHSALERKEKSFDGGNRIFFLALPPHLFGPVTEVVSKTCQSSTGWTRMIIEKPFGHDLPSFKVLNDATSKAFREENLYRIDHYLGKEVIMNLLTLRFTNRIFEPLWNADHIESVHINWKEDLNTRGRAGYFDQSGIIRDVIQNHLLQILALIAMERPKSLNEVADAKRDVLAKIKSVELENCRVGQFTATAFMLDGKEHKEPGYLDDEDVKSTSCTPTYAMIRVGIENERWKGVPFLMSAGKGLDEKLCEVRVRFKPVVPLDGGRPRQNQLVIRVQPEEAIFFRVFTKTPGLNFEPANTTLDLSYRAQFGDARFSDAYEVCLLNCVRGDRSLFVGADELVEAWRIFTPLLHAMDAAKVKPETYEFGSNAPKRAREFAKRFGVELLPSWHELLCMTTCDTVTSLRGIFRSFDKNGNGRISASEFEELLMRVYDGRKPPKSLVAKCMRYFDANKDGEIVFEEFERCLPYLCNRRSRKRDRGAE
eukprot:g45.t1